jgi:hypothetical protein
MKKSDYTRSTTECRFNNLKPSFIQAVKKYAVDYKLGDIEKEVLHCFETTNIKKGFLGKIKTSYTEICITKRFLFWMVVMNENEIGTGAAQWIDISEIFDWETTEMGKLFEDHGVDVFGFMYLASHRSKWFIGLGDDDAGHRCAKLLKEMMAKP